MPHARLPLVPAVLAVLTVLGLGGCRSQGLAEPATPPGPAGAGPGLPPQGYYDVPAGRETPLEDTLWHVERDLEIRRVLLASRLPEDLRHLSHADDPVEVLLFLPRPLGTDRRPAVVMSPVLANSLLLMNEFASGFVRRGWIAAVVMRKEFEFDPATALASAEGEFRTYVIQGRQALDWLASRPDVDAERLATFGVSAGATISACLAASDPRPRAHVLVLAGGPLADVLAETDEDRFVRYRREVTRALGGTPQDLRERLRAALVTDPVGLAPRVRREDVLLFVARQDRAIPTRCGLALWEALGRPRLVTLPWGHYTSFALLAWITNEANAFLASRLAPRAPADAARDPGRP